MGAPKTERYVMTEGVKAGVLSIIGLIMLTALEVVLTVAMFRRYKKCPFVEAHEKEIHS